MKWSTTVISRSLLFVVSAVLLAPTLVVAQLAASMRQDGSNTADMESQSSTPDEAATVPVWKYGGFADGAYLLDFNYPNNHLFRSRGTTYKLDEPILNMAAAYLEKDASEASRWGVQLTVQGGQDSRVFGFSATAPNLPGYRGLRHLGPTNFSYLAPIGKGLTIQGGIFSSLIGYDSLYAKDNFNYTRPWGADFTPYLMLGVNASYPVSDKLTIAGFVVNGYWHLANANAVPSFGGQAAYKATEHWTVKQTFLVGPHQSDTSLQNWRFLTDTIAEWKTTPLTVALEYNASTERVAGNPAFRATWMSGQLPVHWAIDKRWSVTVRPEVAWDSDGRWTLAAQTVKANTTTLEYRVPYRDAALIVRLEHRVDDSRGTQGGFFKDNGALTPTQNLLTLGVILTFDSKFSFKH
jgi:putative OmpL-like beta-barrel porin-2